MKPSERNILRDVIGDRGQKVESRMRKCIRIAFSSIMLGLLAILLVMAALRRFGA